MMNGDRGQQSPPVKLGRGNETHPAAKNYILTHKLLVAASITATRPSQQVGFSMFICTIMYLVKYQLVTTTLTARNGAVCGRDTGTGHIGGPHKYQGRRLLGTSVEPK